MRSDLRALRERIRQVEAGGHRDTPLRRAYNRKLRAHRGLRGGGGLPNEDEDKVRTLEKEVESLKNTKVSVRYIKEHLEKRVSELDDEVSTLKTHIETIRDVFPELLELPEKFLLQLPEKFNELVDKVDSLENKVKAETTKPDSTEGKKAGFPTVRGFKEHVERLKPKQKG